MNYRHMMDFSGKNVLVTGGTGNLGAEFARAFASCGANVMLADINAEPAGEIIAECERLGGRAYFTEVDLLDVESIRNMIARTIEKLGCIDILCNNAGLNIRKPAIEFTEAEWDRLIGVDLKAAFFVATTVGKHMLERGSGRVVNTASVSSARGHKNLALYASAKGGIRQMTKVLAHEWAEAGITVNAVGPGYIITKQTKQYLENPETRGNLLSHIPMKRFGLESEVASLVLFLASEGGAYMTGQTIYVEGGRMID